MKERRVNEGMQWQENEALLYDKGSLLVEKRGRENTSCVH